MELVILILYFVIIYNKLDYLYVVYMPKDMNLHGISLSLYFVEQTHTLCSWQDYNVRVFTSNWEMAYFSFQSGDFKLETLIYHEVGDIYSTWPKRNDLIKNSI